MTCPVCAGRTRDGLMCQPCWNTLRRALTAIPGLLTDLDLAAAKMARLTPPTPGGLASERDPVGWTAADAAHALDNTLTTWLRDVCADHNVMWSRDVAGAAALVLLEHEDTIRAHPAAVQLWTDITNATHRARHAIDRQDRHIDIADCPEDGCGGTLRAHLPAADDRPTTITCRNHPDHHWTPDQWLRLGRRLLATKETG